MILKFWPATQARTQHGGHNTYLTCIGWGGEKILTEEQKKKKEKEKTKE